MRRAQAGTDQVSRSPEGAAELSGGPVLTTMRECVPPSEQLLGPGPRGVAARGLPPAGQGDPKVLRAGWMQSVGGLHWARDAEPRGSAGPGSVAGTVSPGPAWRVGSRGRGVGWEVLTLPTNRAQASNPDGGAPSRAPGVWLSPWSLRAQGSANEGVRAWGSQLPLARSVSEVNEKRR